MIIATMGGMNPNAKKMNPLFLKLFLPEAMNKPVTTIMISATENISANHRQALTLFLCKTLAS